MDLDSTFLRMSFFPNWRKQKITITINYYFCFNLPFSCVSVPHHRGKNIIFIFLYILLDKSYNWKKSLKYCYDGNCKVASLIFFTPFTSSWRFPFHFELFGSWLSNSASVKLLQLIIPLTQIAANEGVKYGRAAPPCQSRGGIAGFAVCNVQKTVNN